MKRSNKNILYNQELTIEEKSLKLKIFNYFYYIITENNQTNIITLYILHILEIFQLISYVFSAPHIQTWKLPFKIMKIISIATGAFRLYPLIQFVPTKVCLIFYCILIIITIILTILMIMQIIFRNTNSRIFNKLLTITHICISPLTVFLYIPLSEIFLSPLICFNGGISDLCRIRTLFLFIVVGIICCIFFSIIIIFLNYFYFYPFQIIKVTVKINSSNDIFLIIIKLLYILRFFLIKNEYFSIIILLFLFLFLSLHQLKSPVYNVDTLEILLNLRNYLILWTYFMLLVAKLCENTEINGIIYLLVFGYPIIIFISIITYKVMETEFDYTNSSFNNITTCVAKARFLIGLVNSYLDESKNNMKYNEGKNQKYDILLKGFIKLHTESCLKEDCPLTKFMKNDGNYNVQKQCLLNYMSIFFNNAMKKFPYNKILKLFYIQFNFYKKYNLNSVRANLEEVKKMKSDIKEEFIVYTIENEISKAKIKDVKEGNEKEQESLVIEQNYKKLKDLISNCTKLYVEFWGIFATNITNNLNTSKLYKLGEKLNLYLKEINDLWEKNLKNKKIDPENENIAQLYSRFLREILWAKNKSEEIQKKINEEHQVQGFKKLEEENSQLDNFGNIIENQDYVIFVNSNDKGKCIISQYSNSLIYLIGYQKQEIINKPLEILMPSIFIDGHSKKVEEFITMHYQKISDKDSFRGMEKKRTFILIKNKMGYLVPFNAKFTIFDDNDFSNSFLIKAQLEINDIKSMYAYYILANPDFSIESISSSAIHMGLTMDLLKKYVIKLNILIRTHKDNVLNLYEKYKNFREEQKKVVWVFPDVIYPKNDIAKNKETPIQDLIKISEKKKIYLQIIEMRYSERELIGFVFKFVEIQNNKKNKNEINSKDLFPPFKNEIIFDMLSLHYIRTIIVKKKSGLRNLREKEEDNESKGLISSKILTKKRKTKKKTNKAVIDEESSEDEKIKIFLTKEKIMELQTKDSNGIKSFINILPFYGEEISLIKHRPNKEKYPAGKAQEPLIKIDVSNFTRRIDSKLRENPEFYRKFKNMQTEMKQNYRKESNTINTNFEPSNANNNEIYNKNNEEINKDIMGNSSASLINIFNVRSTKIIKYIDFFIYLFIILSLTIEIIFSYSFYGDNKLRFIYLSDCYKILSHICYTKYFITEAVITNSTQNYIELDINKKKYISYIKSELTYYREELTELFDLFSSKEIEFSKEFSNYLSNTIVNIATISNEQQTSEKHPFTSTLNKLTTAIFYLSTMSDSEPFNMKNKYSYELMVNLLNSYFSTFEALINIMVKDYDYRTKHYGIRNIYIFSVTITVSVIFIIIFWRMMSKLDNDREKPINLFLTIKKKVFEDLKNSSENFSNKLLNKVFGNEENDEESQQEYISNVKSNDINIAKFKALNEYKASINKKSSFIFYFIQIILLFFIFNFYFLIKYVNSAKYYQNVHKFSIVYNETRFSHIYLIARINLMKQYYFDNTIPSLNYPTNMVPSLFNFCFMFMSLQFGETIISSSNMVSFFKKKYEQSFIKYFYNNYNELIKEENKNNLFNDLLFNLSNNYSNYYKKTENGFLQTTFDIFEIIRFITIEYFINDTRNKNNISDLIYDKRWFDLNEILIYLVRPWYNNMIELLDLSLYDLMERNKVLYLAIYFIFIILISFYYWIIWKSYEENFINLIKKSFDLINLIPEEIKNIIVLKLNEY